MLIDYIYSDAHSGLFYSSQCSSGLKGLVSRQTDLNKKKTTFIDKLHSNTLENLLYNILYLEAF